MQCQSCDYVVVGAGSAGCVVANRLSEDPNLFVALLDAGPDQHELSKQEQSWLSRPELFQYMQDTRLDWQYWMEPQRELTGRSLFCPRGKVVGGTSTFIAGMYIRGNRNDYDEWAKLGNPGWDYDDVLPYFKRIERNLRQSIDTRFHSANGTLAVADIPGGSRATQTFLRVVEELGYRRNTDFNGAAQDGFGMYQFYLNEEGTRVNSANGYLTPSVRSRKNLAILSNAHAQEVILERSNGALCARGVRYVDRTGGDRAVREIAATHEVIVCCGAIDSPKLLMLSGIGPEEQLVKHGIRPQHRLAGVGENYQDHLVIPMGWLYKPGAELDKLVASGIDAGMFVRSNEKEKTPNLQFVFNHAVLGPPGEIFKIGFQIVPALVDPKSRGRVTLRSGAPWAPASIYGGFLSDPRDLQVLVNGVRRALRIVGHRYFDEIRGAKLPVAPPPNFDASAEEIERFIRGFSATLFHPSGTCKMGPKNDRAAVVDAELRVHGVQGLRVVDASIMPTVTTGNCHTPVTMIGEKASDMIRRARPSDFQTTITGGKYRENARNESMPAPMSGIARFLPPSFPPGVNPETFRLDEVRQLLESAAYFPIFSVHNSSVPNKPIYSLCSPISPVAVEVNESLHRFALHMNEDSGDGHICATNQVGNQVANVFIRWTVIPEDYEAAPGKKPPPTSLNPFRSQRFAMLDGEFRFRDHAGSGFKGFGTGRTFPVESEGRLRIGAVVDIVEGYGQLSGAKGTVVINGFIEPPQGLALNMMVRILDPDGRYQSTEELLPVQAVPDPDPNATFMAFLGEVDADRPVRLITSPDGQIKCSIVYEKLRLVDLDFDITDASGIRSKVHKGPVVGSLSAQLNFNPLSPSNVSPISTKNGVFTFVDERGSTIGTICSDMVEGRALRTEIPGAPFPIFRFGGFGPILGGSGQFADADGMMSMNAAISVFPRTLSNLYVFRIYDPSGRYRETCLNAWQHAS